MAAHEEDSIVVHHSGTTTTLSLGPITLADRTTTQMGNQPANDVAEHERLGLSSGLVGGFRFLDLPPEVRNTIYDCSLTLPAYCELSIGASWDFESFSAFALSDEDCYVATFPGSVLPSVCRQTHGESLRFLYGGNCFLFNSCDVLTEFLDNIGPGRAYIRELRLRDCSRMLCKYLRFDSTNLSLCTSLTRLELSLDSLRDRQPKASREFFRHSGGKRVVSRLKPVLEMLYKKHQTVDGVLQILHCRRCHTPGTVIICSDCKTYEVDYPQFVKRFIERITRTLQNMKK